MCRNRVISIITFAIINQKGGVGKTTIAFNLAKILAVRFKKKVLAIDNDPQGNLTSSFLDEQQGIDCYILDAYDEKPLVPTAINQNLDLLASDINLAPVSERAFPVIFNLKNGIKQLNSSRSKKYDFVIIDCLPSFGHLNLAALVAADFVLIPVKPSPYSLAGMQDLIKTIEKVKTNLNDSLKILGIIINQVEGRKTNLQFEIQAALRDNYQQLVFKSTIKKRISLEESPVFNKDIVTYRPQSPSSEEFVLLVKEILRKIKNGDVK